MQIYLKNSIMSSFILLVVFLGQMPFSAAKALTKADLLSKVKEAGNKCQEMQRDMLPDVVEHLWDHNTGTSVCNKNISVCTKLGVVKRLFTFDMYKTRYNGRESLNNEFTRGRLTQETEMNNLIKNSPNVDPNLERNISEKIQNFEKYCEAQVLVIQGPEFTRILSLYNTLYGK
ncbi:MAG: hypothetical protein BGO67_02125 [Alphaproteobacteria bacterium 41-28]|nr:MAG: hypothetical protein BGO67_02125 [Alphaproteobacteria bacterium 41-28]